MQSPTHVFSQVTPRRHLRHEGWCWGFSVRWLRECMSGGPSVAGLAMGWGATAHEAMLSHDAHANQGPLNDLVIRGTTINLSGRRLDATRRDLSSTAGLPATAASIAAVMGEGESFRGLIIFEHASGAHAVAVANVGNVWALFDPEFGTWTFAGTPDGAPPAFLRLLADDLRHYSAYGVRLFAVTRWQEPVRAVACAEHPRDAGRTVG